MFSSGRYTHGNVKQSNLSWLPGLPQIRSKLLELNWQSILTYHTAPSTTYGISSFVAEYRKKIKTTCVV